MSKQNQTWTEADAKAQFSAVIDRALSEGPQTITRRGQDAAVVVAAEEWSRRLRRQGSLAEFFADSPLRGSGLRTPVRKGGLRKVRL